jgi:hypothetical protein
MRIHPDRTAGGDRGYKEKLKSNNMASRQDAKKGKSTVFIRAVARKGGFKTISFICSEVLPGEAGIFMVSFAPLRLCTMHRFWFPKKTFEFGSLRIQAKIACEI